MTTPLPLANAAGQMLLLTFAGFERPPDTFVEILKQIRPAGVSLFRDMNIESPAQVRRLTAALQSLAAQAGLPLLLIGTDQEGGQLMAVGSGATPFPGNMALGAAGSNELAQRVGRVIGLELAAMGVNINYAPAVDVNINPKNPVVGTRSFGEDPTLVGRLGAAMVSGIQSAGVAATAKHFPGHGDTSSDSHYGAPILPHNAERLRRVELPPFDAAIQAGVELVMSAHVALPALNRGLELPATLSPLILRKLLRKEMGFRGVVISDAMNMHAIRQGAGLPIEVIAAARAGVDLILLIGEPALHSEMHAALVQAAERGLLSAAGLRASARRVLALKRRLAAAAQPDLAVVGCAEHHALAREVAETAITLVRDREGLLPLRPGDHSPIAVAFPQPQNLTPADTSSSIPITLAEALRRRLPRVDEYILPFDPDPNSIAEMVERLSAYPRVVLGTINAFEQPGQAALANALLARGVATVFAALRLPYDLAVFPRASTYLCTYSVQPPAMEALAAALCGEIACKGILPVRVAGAA